MLNVVYYGLINKRNSQYVGYRIGGYNSFESKQMDVIYLINYMNKGLNKDKHVNCIL